MLQQSVTQYLQAYDTQRRLSAVTRRHYARDLKHWIAFLEAQGVHDVADLTPRHLQDFLVQQYKRGLHPRTLQRLRAAMRGWLQWGATQGWWSDPQCPLNVPKMPQRLPDLLEVEILERILARASWDDRFWDVRDQAIIELLYSSGLRVSELCRVNVEDLEGDTGTLRVAGKGGKTRMVPVGRSAWEAVTRWRALRDPVAMEPALFVTNAGSRLSVRSIEKRVQRLGKLWGVRLYPHLLRHCCATHLLGSSGQLRAVQELLGHASLHTTALYTQLDAMALAHVYDASHPRAKGDN